MSKITPRAAILAVLAALLLGTSPQPAGAQPDHYKCYRSKQVAPPFAAVEGLEFTDQFESVFETVKRPLHFCNPVDKDGSGIGDPTAHLNCYKTKRVAGEPRFQKQIVNIDNQFGPQTLELKKPRGICVPAEKDMVPSALEINSFKCYRAKGVFPKQIVTLEDQFETKVTTVKKPHLFCNPMTIKGGGIGRGAAIVDPSNHLTCYTIRRVAGESKFPGKQVEISDVFGASSATAKLGHAGLLCVPTLKEGAPTPTPTPAPTPTPTPAPTATAPYGSASQAFVRSVSTLLR